MKRSALRFLFGIATLAGLASFIPRPAEASNYAVGYFATTGAQCTDEPGPPCGSPGLGG